MRRRGKGGEHYFSERPTGESSEHTVWVALWEREFSFRTDVGVFSRRYLDRGTRLLLNTLPLPMAGDVLDLGAGWGPIGTVVGALSPEARVVMAEVNERAAGLAASNAASNGALQVEVIAGDALELPGELEFDVIITNPPIHAGKALVMELLRDARERLRPGGSFWMVARTRDGAKSYQAALEEMYPHVERVAMRGGYRVLHARRA